MTAWVVDTSPLIFLSKLNRLDFLQKGAERILALWQSCGRSRSIQPP